MAISGDVVVQQVVWDVNFAEYHNGRHLIGLYQIMATTQTFSVRITFLIYPSGFHVAVRIFLAVKEEI